MATYPELGLFNSFFLLGMTGPNSRITADMRKPTKLSSGSGNASGLGLQNEKRGCCNLQQERLVSLLTGSRIYKVPMVHDGLRLRNPAIRQDFREVIHVSTGWICHHIQIMRV